MKKNLSIVSILLLASCLGPAPKKKNVEPEKSIKVDTASMVLLSGKYKVLLMSDSNPTDTEVFTLREDGAASWAYINDYGRNSEKVEDTKKGKWYSNNDTIVIELKGNSGPIESTYIKKSNIFVNKTYDSRSLERIEQ